jgi:ribonuclease HI
MSAAPLLNIHTDGASRGNPGAAAFAYVIRRDGEAPIEEAGCLGQMTNNQAEYTALVRALECAVRLGTHYRLVIHSDSELMVKQMRGEYRVKDQGLRPFYERACELWERFRHKPTIRHVPRAQNGRADELCNLVLDGKPVGSALGSAEEADDVHAQAVLLLSSAADAWAQGEKSLSPEQVWKRLWRLLEQHGLVSPDQAEPSARTAR